MKVHTVIFDLDGTLLDTTQGVLESVKHAAREMGFCVLPYETLLKFVGPPIQNSFIDYYGCDNVQAQYAANIFRDYYKNEALLKAKPYDGIFTLCEELKRRGKKLAIATYKREDYALRLLNYFGFGKYCISMHGADNNNILKKSDIVNMCMRETGGKPDNTVLVGDTVHDALGAEKAGVSFIGVTYGFGFLRREDLSQFPNSLAADNTNEILQAIENYEIQG